MIAATVVWHPGMRHTPQHPHDHDVPAGNQLSTWIDIAEDHQVIFGIEALPRAQRAFDEAGRYCWAVPPSFGSDSRRVSIGRQLPGV